MFLVRLASKCAFSAKDTSYKLLSSGFFTYNKVVLTANPIIEDQISGAIRVEPWFCRNFTIIPSLYKMGYETKTIALKTYLLHIHACLTELYHKI
jgi:hypothetical protein